MFSAPVNLLLYYIGFGYVLFLAWGIIDFDASKPHPPPWTRTVTTILLIAGFAHPAAALAAWDLRRQLARDRSDPNARPAVSLILIVVSVVIATAVVIVATQT